MTFITSCVANLLLLLPFAHASGRTHLCHLQISKQLGGKEVACFVWLTGGVLPKPKVPTLTTKEVVKYVSQVETKVVLIDGEQLAQLMIDHHLGVSTVSSYEIKKADFDYFAED